MSSYNSARHYTHPSRRGRGDDDRRRRRGHSPHRSGDDDAGGRTRGRLLPPRPSSVPPSSPPTSVRGGRRERRWSRDWDYPPNTPSNGSGISSPMSGHRCVCCHIISLSKLYGSYFRYNVHRYNLCEATVAQVDPAFIIVAAVVRWSRALMVLQEKLSRCEIYVQKS